MSPPDGIELPDELLFSLKANSEHVEEDLNQMLLLRKCTIFTSLHFAMDNVGDYDFIN